MSSEVLDKSVSMDNWQIFSKKISQHFIHHKKILKVTTPPPSPGANRVKKGVFLLF